MAPLATTGTGAQVVPTAGFLVRIHVEERTLFAALGEPYRLFTAHRPRLVPGLW